MSPLWTRAMSAASGSSEGVASEMGRDLPEKGWFQRSPASNRNDATGVRLSLRRNCRPENVKYTIQIEIKHALKSCVVGVRYRLAASETTDRVRQNIELSETRYNLVYEDLGALTSGNLCR
jgi:hypothetical protein